MTRDENSQHQEPRRRRRKTRSYRPPTNPGLWLLVAFGLVLCLTVAVLLPGPGVLKAIGVVGVAGLTLSHPKAWLWVFFGLMPLCMLSPWTGWVFVSEFDVLVGLCLAGGALRNHRGAIALTLPRTVRWAFWGLVLVWTLALLRAQPWDLVPSGDALGNYLSRAHSLYQFKALVYAGLIWPLLARYPGAHLRNELSLALLLCLWVGSMAVIYERAAGVGLLNMSSDYRATGSFHEMHIGGAALDGFLVLLFGWNLIAILARDRSLRAAGLLCAPFALYAILATFSRGVYLGVAVCVAVLLGLVIWIRLRSAKQRVPLANAEAPALSLSEGLVSGAALLVLGLLAAQVFSRGGYRTLFTYLTLAGMVYLLGAGRTKAWAPSLAAVLGGLAIAAGGLVLSRVVPKAAYGVVGLWTLAGLVAVAAIIWRKGAAQLSRYAALWLALALAMAGGTLGVARHWGGDVAFEASVLPVCTLLALGLLSWLAGPLWHVDSQRLSAMAGAVGLLAMAVTLFASSYANERFRTSGQDFAGRVAHWGDGLGLMKQSPLSPWIGVGLGRYHAEYASQMVHGRQPSAYGFFQEGDLRGFSLLAGLAPKGELVEPLRLQQRIKRTQGPLTVEMTYRGALTQRIAVEVCDKWLLYRFNCSNLYAPKQKGDGWHTVRFTLPAQPPAGMWPSPTHFGLNMFYDKVELVDLKLLSVDGQNLIKNGDFQQGTDHWFVTSDRDHLPWHAKNMLIHIVVETGALGFLAWAAFLIACVSATWRNMMKGSDFAQSAVVAGAGFLAVAFFDSMIDFPRLTVLLLLTALSASARMRST